MTKQRALTQLELLPVENAGEQDWVDARWRRADGSGGSVFAQLRRKTEHDWYVARLQVDLPTGELLRDIPLAKIEAAANASKPIHRYIAEGVKTKHSPRTKLKRPAKRKLDEQFFGQVAVAYIDAVVYGLPPAKTLAEDSDTPLGTVNRWIAKARELGYLQQTTPGEAKA